MNGVLEVILFEAITDSRTKKFTYQNISHEKEKCILVSCNHCIVQY